MKYCDQIKAIVRNKTLSIEAKLDPIDESMDASPLEMYAPYSRFLFTILNKNQGKMTAVKANIIIPDIPSIIKRTDIAVKKIIECEGVTIKEDQPVNLAFTEKIRFGMHKGKSPGEVLIKDPSQKETLLSMRDTLKEYVAKYPANANLIKSIEAAVQLSDNGNLPQPNNTVGTVKIYETNEKYFTSERDKNNEGYFKVYKINVTCDPSKNYPFNVSIMNCHAPVEVQPDKTTKIKMSMAKDVITFNINLTEMEWTDIVYKMENTMRNFEQINSLNAHKQNEKLRWKPDTAVNS